MRFWIPRTEGGLPRQGPFSTRKTFRVVFDYRFQHLPDCRILFVVGHFSSSIFGFGEPLEY
jgi:hypothetical protein